MKIVNFVSKKYIRMKITVEISMYPLKDNYVDPILSFIKKLNDIPKIKVITNTLSTQISGEYETVMKCLSDELKPVFEKYITSFVIKIVNV